MPKKIVIVDIDGTVANIDERVKHIQVKPKDWKKFYAEAGNDTPIQEIIHLVHALDDFGYEVVFCTGRNESSRDLTLAWIDQHIGGGYRAENLLMRRDGDYRPDHEVKLEAVVQARISIQDIAFVLEDRDQMVRAWRDLGVRCLQVADGNY